MLSTPSAFAVGGPKEGQFLGVFLPMITAVVGFWATLSLNISDFTRYATSQDAQFKGQTLGLPFFMAAFTFMSVAITSCSAVIYGVAVADPVALLAKANGGVLTTAVAMGGLLIATLSTNIAANIVAPANAFVNLAPSKLSFRLGGIVTAVLGTVICPWRLMADAGGYIFVWLIGTFIGWFSYGRLN
jgi:NCS1 family nucleobase:cation symporter-1|tara:strand:+ start:155 stop:715 length:561 start_codon:yes stop_codon:yes gene_type:complete